MLVQGGYFLAQRITDARKHVCCCVIFPETNEGPRYGDRHLGLVPRRASELGERHDRGSRHADEPPRAAAANNDENRRDRAEPLPMGGSQEALRDVAGCNPLKPRGIRWELVS